MSTHRSWVSYFWSAFIAPVSLVSSAPTSVFHSNQVFINRALLSVVFHASVYFSTAGRREYYLTLQARCFCAQFNFRSPSPAIIWRVRTSMNRSGATCTQLYLHEDHHLLVGGCLRSRFLIPTSGVRHAASDGSASVSFGGIVGGENSVGIPSW